MAVQELICVLLAVAGVQSLMLDAITDCDNLCHHRHQADELLLTLCGCPHQGHHTTKPRSATTTLSMCDYLCSIQMGGSACDCSVSIVPGR